MNESTYSFSRSFISDSNIKAKISYNSTSHYGCSHCARVLSEEEIVEHFESPGGMDDLLNYFDENCKDSAMTVDEKLVHNVILSMNCPNCQETIDGIEILVSGILGNSMMSEESPTLLGSIFISTIIHGVVPNSTQPVTFSELSFNTLNYTSFSKATEEAHISLIIVAKTHSFNGDCYMGFCLEHKGFYRPIIKEYAGQYCWPKNEEIKIAGYYGFKGYFRSKEYFNRQLVFECGTPYPHRINDLMVEPVIKLGNCDILDNVLDLYSLIIPYSKESLEEIFAPAEMNFTSTNRCYLYEGSKCPSFGVLRISLSLLEFNLENEDKKPRLCFWDKGMNKRCNLSWTSYENFGDKIDKAREISRNSIDDEALVLIGFGRGWRGKGNMLSEKMCFLLAIGLIFNTI